MAKKSTRSSPKPTTSKYLTESAHSKYEEIMSSRNMYLEKAFNLTSEPSMGHDQHIWTVIFLQNWRKFVGPPHSIAEEVVREFYANMVEGEEQKVYVRGRFVDMSPRAINKFYALEPKTEGMFDFPAIPNEEQKQKLLKVLCLPDSKWYTSTKGAQTVKYSNMTLGSKIWLNILRTKLMPTSHTGTVSMTRASLLYCMVQGLPVNVGNIINSGMKACAKKKKGDLWFPSLVSGLCKSSGVPIEESEWSDAPVLLTHEALQLLANKQDIEEEEHPEEEEDQKEEEKEEKEVVTPFIGSRTRAKGKGKMLEKTELKGKSGAKSKGKSKVVMEVDLTEEEDAPDNTVLEFEEEESEEEEEADKEHDKKMEEWFAQARGIQKSIDDAEAAQQRKRKRAGTPAAKTPSPARAMVTNEGLLESIEKLTKEVKEIRSNQALMMEMMNEYIDRQIKVWKFENAKSAAKNALRAAFPHEIIPRKESDEE